MNREIFIEECKKIGIDINKSNLEKFNEYYKLLCEWNEKINLTTIIEENDVYLKHFYDSLCLLKSIDLNNELTLCDVGTGAGFPGIVLKIVFPKLKITLLEPIQKKCIFLNTVIEHLELRDIKVINERAEIYAQKNREKFDIVTCRAVSKLRIISEISLPMVKVGGYFIPLKANINDEIIESKQILKELNSKIISVIEFKLPFENSNRNIIKIQKLKSNSIKYPRNYGKIKKN